MYDEELSKNINIANSNMCYFFITDYNDYKKNSFDVKNILRAKYPNPDNKHWNYIHSSDNIKEAEKEIKLLFSSSLKFDGIGTYYSQKDV